MITRLVLVSLAIAFASPTLSLWAADLRVIGWNVQDSGAIPRANEQRLRQLAGQDVALWGLSEVDPDNFDRYLDAVWQGAADAELDTDFNVVEGQSGGNIRLMIIYDKNRIEKLNDFALSGLQFGSGGRAPLLIRARDKLTDKEFLFSVNHFHRGSEEKRQQQAEGFRGYAASQTLPIIAVGDYNFDVDVPFGNGNQAFKLFTQGDVLKWIRPKTLVSTNYSDGRKFPDGVVDLVLKTKQGDDDVDISGNIAGNAFLDTGPDDDGIAFDSGLSVGGNLEIDTREGNDAVGSSSGFLNVGGNLTVNTRQGDDSIGFFTTGFFGEISWQVGGDVTFDTGQGNDIVSFAAGLLGFGSYTIDIGGDFEVTTGQGDDSVAVVAVDFFFASPTLLSIGGSLRVDLGQGNDTFSTTAQGGANGAIVIAGDFEVRAGGGDDGVSVNADFGSISVGGDLTLDGGPGIDGPAPFDPVVLDPAVSVAGAILVKNFE